MGPTILAWSQLLLALGTLLGTVFAGINSLKNGKKIADVKATAETHTAQLADIKTATQGMSASMAGATQEVLSTQKKET